jgi:peptidoglycan/xylan/chitin deacetylase (PgdA/CDA1 family)
VSSPLRAAARRTAEQIAPRRFLLLRGPARGRRVALTFDDGPHAHTAAYLDALERLDLRATFFLVGRACVERPSAVLEMVRRGHEVANHSFTHRLFPSLDRRAIEEELARTQALLPPAARPMVRPPQGATSLASLAACARAGFRTVLWSLDSQDYRLRDPGEVAAQVQPARVRAGEIVLLHEGQPWTLAALPEIAGGLRAAGFHLCTVGELLDG